MVGGLMLSMAFAWMSLFPWFGKKEDPFPPRDENGNIVISAEGLSRDKVSFIRIAEDSKIELLAILDADGEIKIALGACQSCGGSPYAYYVQQGDRLICNNCGLSFPLSEIGEAGSGCHPIRIPEKIITGTDDGLLLDTEALLEYEVLFENVIEH